MPSNALNRGEFRIPPRLLVRSRVLGVSFDGALEVDGPRCDGGGRSATCSTFPSTSISYICKRNI